VGLGKHIVRIRSFDSEIWVEFNVPRCFTVPMVWPSGS